jgi:hypothetical protein
MLGSAVRVGGQDGHRGPRADVDRDPRRRSALKLAAQELVLVPESCTPRSAI